MANDTNRQAVVGMIWRFAERMGVQLITFIVSIVLARLLSPEDFGTLALLMVVINLLQVFIDNGIGSAIIQKKDVDRIDYSTALFFNILFCTGLYVLIFFAAPFIANFYNNEQITAYIRVLSLNIIISGIRNIQYSVVARALQFKLFFNSTLSGMIVGAITGITLAYLGFGVWALVAQQLTTNLVSTVVLALITKIDFSLTFSIERLKELLSFSWKLLAAAFLNVLYNNLRQLAIGKVYSTSELAYYNRGEAMPAMVVGSIGTSIDSVLFSTMAKYQDDAYKIKSMTKRAIGLSSYVLWPTLVGLAAVSYPLIQVLLTDKWLAAVPFLQIFALAYAFWPMHTANLNAVKSLGRSDVFLKLEVVKKFGEMAILLITIPMGPMVIALSVLLMSIVGVFINSIPTKKLLNYGFIEQLIDVFPSIAMSGIMAFCIYPLRFLGLPAPLLLILQAAAGVLIYIGFSYVTKDQNFKYIFEKLMKVYKKRVGKQAK